MKYTVSPYVFEKNPNLLFGLVIGKKIINENTSTEDHENLQRAEKKIRQEFVLEDLKTHNNYTLYRHALKAFEINPNKYMNSIEAMSKRILKGSDLPRINALVDNCNAIGLKYQISLGGHDLGEIHDDLEVRLSKTTDVFQAFGKEVKEAMPADELVFISGSEVQTRYWLWRQSELGKMTLESKNIFFQLVGFEERRMQLEYAIRELENLITHRFGGKYESFIVSQDQRFIEF